MSEEKQDIQQPNDECVSLQEIAEKVFQETKAIYEEKDYIEESSIFQSATSSIILGDNSVRIFGRVHSIEELEKQNKFFMEQTCLMMRHIIWQIQRIIETKAFENQQILQFLKTIAFKQLEEDLWQLQYLDQFQAIINCKVNKYTPLTQHSQDMFIRLWIEAREFSQETNKAINQEYERKQNPTNSTIAHNRNNLKILCPNIQSQIYTQSLIQLKSDMGKPKYVNSQNSNQSVNKIKQVPYQQIEEKKKIQINHVSYQLKITKIKQKQKISLLPDGKIFSGVFSKQSHLPLSRSIEIREINTQLLIPTQNLVQIQYKGELNLNLIPHGQGELVTKRPGLTISYKGGFRDGCLNGDGVEYRNGKLHYKGKFVNNYKNGEGCIAISDKDYIKGIFLCDRKNGIFQASSIGENEQIIVNKQYMYCFEVDRPLDKSIPYDNQMITKFKQQNNNQQVYENPSYSILQIGQISLDNFQLNSLNPGKLQNSSIIDAFINIQHNFELLRRNNKIENPYLIINVANCQDIFSSVITNLNELNYNEFEKIHRIQQQKLKISKFKRILFMFNYDQSHFLIFQYEQETLYQIDSMDCDRSVLYQLIVKLLYRSGYILKNYIRLPVKQQNNIYDCGSYACFYAMQLLRYQHLPQQKQFQMLDVEPNLILRFRQHVCRVLYNSNESIYPISLKY